MTVWIVLLIFGVWFIGKMTAKSMDMKLKEEEERKKKEALQRELERKRLDQERQQREARAALDRKMREIEERQKRREQILMANGERFDRDLAALPRVEIQLQPSPAMQPISPVWSLFTYRNVTKASRLETLGDFITVDVETTGLHPELNEIVQLSAVTFRNFEAVDCFTSFVKPEKGINAKAASVNHITEETVADAPLLGEIRSAFRSYVGEELPIVGHNLEFDLKFLVLSGCLKPDVSRRYYDTLALSRRTWNEGPYKLESLGEDVLGIRRSDAHTALSDAYITGLLFQKICHIRTNKQ